MIFYNCNKDIGIRRKGRNKNDGTKNNFIKRTF